MDIDEFYHSFDQPMQQSERQYLRQKTKSMFLHSYNSYKTICNHTCDYVKPISCQPIYHYSTGDVDGGNEFYGNFSLTLVESLDTMAIMGLHDEFYESVNKIIAHLTFNKDLIGSVFELNIRLLGGLLSAHNFIYKIEPLRVKFTTNSYNDELLTLAKDLGDRLMVAFDQSPTGIPYKKIYLNRHKPLTSTSSTTTADVGSCIVEFCTLSHMTNKSKYCDTALSILDKLWSMRSSKLHLPFQYLDSNDGRWRNKLATLGSGIDSYFEYLMKGYIMTGNVTLYERFVEHYESIEQYLKTDYSYGTNSGGSRASKFSSIDAFESFWPSIQILYGDFKNGLHFYYYLFKGLTSHVFLPETMSSDSLSSSNPSFNLRPELIESTYYLYKATKDPFFLNVGKFVLYTTENYCRSKCGYSTLSSGIRGSKNDHTESFFLSEYLKYMYLLFSIDDNDLTINLDDYVFNTEAHPLPIFNTDKPRLFNNWKDNTLFTYPKDSYYCDLNNIRTDRDLVLKDIEQRTNVSKNSFNEFHSYYLYGKSQNFKPNFDLNNDYKEYLKMINNNNNVDLNYTINNYKSKKIYMGKPAFIQLPSSTTTAGGSDAMVKVGVAIFGQSITKYFTSLEGQLSKAEPFDACSKLTNSHELVGKIVLVTKGHCNFVVKIRNIQRSGGIAAYILDNQRSNDAIKPMISYDYHNDILIPAVFLSLIRPNNRDIFNLHNKIIRSSNQELRAIKSIIFPNDLSINIVFN